MTETTVATSGARLRVRLDGPPGAPVLVLAGSLGTTLALWDHQVAALAGYFRVLRYDHRGHGGSSAPAGPYSIADLGQDLVDVLDGLGIEQAAVCGLSLGGMVAMWAAAKRPERIGSLVLACTAPYLGPAADWQRRAAAVRAGGTALLAPALFERWFPARLRAERPDLLDQVAAMLSGCDDEGYAGCCEAIGGMDLRPDLGSIAAPTLVVAGADDPVTTPAASLAWAEPLGAAFVVLPGASHLANLASPEAFADAVVAHVTGGPLARGRATRRAVLGDAHVDRTAGRKGVVWPAFGDFITRYAWGEIWSRPGLDRRTRSAVTLALLVGLGRHGELDFHVPAALRNGLTPAEIGEIVLQCAIYAGVPAANAALPAVEAALAAARPTGRPEQGPPGPAGP
ncbi:MAG: 3-oxoadipate enol-lactonase [Acidimicrobiales bacterium]